MVETAIYVLLGALATALLALLALPAISRRAFRLAEARARLLAPLSETQARADRDALRARHAVDVALIERQAAKAQDAWSAAQIALGRQATAIVERDADLADKSEQLAGQREELAARARELRDRDAEIAAREVAMFDLLNQRDAANLRLADAWARIEDYEARLDEGRMVQASLETRVALLEIELADVRRASDNAMSAATDAVVDIKRKIAEREAEAERLQEQLAEISAHARALAGAGERSAETEAAEPPSDSADVERLRDALAESAARERDLDLRVRALATARMEIEAAMRTARSERDTLVRDLTEARTAAIASERRLEAVTEGDKSLRQAIARLGREIAEGRALTAADLRAVDRPLTSDLTL